MATEMEHIYEEKMATLVKESAAMKEEYESILVESEDQFKEQDSQYETERLKVDKLQDEIDQINTVVHEANHVFNPSFIVKSIESGKIKNVSYFYGLESHYIGNGKTIFLKRTRTFPARKIKKIFPEYMGKVHPAFFKNRTITHNPRATSTTFRALPLVLMEMRTAILQFQALADTVLQGQ